MKIILVLHFWLVADTYVSSAVGSSISGFSKSQGRVYHPQLSPWPQNALEEATFWYYCKLTVSKIRIDLKSKFVDPSFYFWDHDAFKKVKINQSHSRVYILSAAMNKAYCNSSREGIIPAPRKKKSVKIMVAEGCQQNWITVKLNSPDDFYILSSS